MRILANKYFVSGIVLLLSVIHLIAYNVKGKDRLNFLEKSILFITYPTISGINTVTGKIENLYRGYVFLVGLRRENLELRRKNGVLNREISKLKEIELENARLRELLNFTKDTDEKYTAARVVSSGTSNFYHTLIINRGSEGGIKRGMAVITNEGAVGQISYVKKGYSSVLTLLDPNSAIDAIDQETRARGVLRGYSQKMLEFKYLPFSEKIKVGDKVVSSGMDGVYPKGITIGHIKKVNTKKERLFQDVIVNPAVDFSELEEVLVSLREKKEFEIDK